MRRSNSFGFSALALIGSVLVGSALSLGYVNLSHYLIAQSALEQSTRVAVRCISPTNGDCSSLVQPVVQPKWKYLASVLSPSGDVYSQEYAYSARMFRQRYIAETPYYAVPQELAPKVRISTFNLPTARYREIQSYKNVDLVFQYQAEEAHFFAEPLANPFPVFDQSFETEHENFSFNRKISDANRSQRELLEGFQVVYTAPFSETISGNESERLNSDFIRQINLGPAPFIQLSSLLNGENQTEGCASGKICSVRSLAGGTGVSRADEYKDFRYLAFYLEVEIKSHTPNASLGIKGEGGRSGLNIDISDSRSDSRICLGGRDLTKLNSLNGNFFNLWLRGAAGSNGGFNNSFDQQCSGDYRHSNIRVNKNGQFRPEIGLVLGGQRGDRVSGRVTLRAFVDRYRTQTLHQRITKNCAPVPLKRGIVVAELAPSPKACGLVGDEKNITRKIVSFREQVIGCLANSEDLTSIPLATKLPAQIIESDSFASRNIIPNEVTLAKCQLDGAPMIPSACGWSFVDGSDGMTEVGNLINGSCPRAEIKEELVYCSTDRPVSSCNVDSLKIESCPSIKAKTEQLRVSGEISGLPIGASSQYRAELVRGSQIEPKTSCNQEKSTDGQLECGILQKKTLLSSPQLVRKDLSWRPTDIGHYEVSGNEPVCEQIRSGQVAIASSTKEVIPISGFPFDEKSSLEVSNHKPALINGKIQCGLDSSTPLPLEETLREYAALSGYSDARDSQIDFQYEARPLGSIRLISSTSGCRTKDFEQPSGCPLLRTFAVGAEACGSEVDLGSLDHEPVQCKDSGVICRKEFDGISQVSSLQHTSENSVELAKQLAESVLQKYLPQSSANCSSANCTKVRLELNPDKTLSVVASYAMPLTWPLDELLGKKSLELRRARTERIEAL